MAINTDNGTAIISDFEIRARTKLQEMMYTESTDYYFRHMVFNVFTACFLSELSADRVYLIGTTLLSIPYNNEDAENTMPRVLKALVKEGVLRLTSTARSRAGEMFVINV